MADFNNSCLRENSFVSNSPTSNEDIIIRRENISALNRSTNKLVNSSSVLSCQEIFGREISKVQELMLEQERSCEAELEELERKLAEFEEENSAQENKIADFESKDSEQSEKTYEMLERENKKLAEQLTNTLAKNKEISHVIDEYQRSVSRFKSQHDTEDQQLIEQKKVLAVERDSALKLVDTMEMEFNNIHQRYEKCKNVIEHLKVNERKLADLSHESSDKLHLLSILTQNLKEGATEKIEQCHNEICGFKKMNKINNAKMEAVLQRMNVTCQSQEEIILQNVNEIQETVEMCNRLIGNK